MNREVLKFLNSITRVQNSLIREGKLPSKFVAMNNNQDLVRLSLRLQNLMRNSFDSYMKDSYQHLKLTLEEIGEDAITFNKLVIELGYPPHGDIPADLISGVAGNYEVEGIEEVKEYIDDLYFHIYEDQKIDALMVKWENNKILKNRLPILRNVIKCHTQQMYFASIPTLLPQLEGIMAEFYNHNGQMNGKVMKKYLDQTLKVERISEYSIEDALHDFYLEHILVKFNHGEELKSNLSRHAILHGGDYKYGTKQNSLKLILMFDYLSDLLETLNENMHSREIVRQTKS